MTYPCTGVILAGGLNSRFNGKNKAFIQIGGKKIIDRLYETFSDLFEHIIIVTNSPLQYLVWEADIVTDIFPCRSSLTGIHSGLFYTTTPYAVFTACDYPFLKKELVQAIMGHIEENIDIVVPQTSSGLEPLCAVYSRNCLKAAENQLIRKKFKISLFYDKVRVKQIPQQVLQKTDAQLISFFNINTPEQLKQILEM